MTDVVRKLIEATKEYLRITDRATDANARVRAAIAAVEREDKPEPPAKDRRILDKLAQEEMADGMYTIPDDFPQPEPEISELHDPLDEDICCVCGHHLQCKLHMHPPPFELLGNHVCDSEPSAVRLEDERDIARERIAELEAQLEESKAALQETALLDLTEIGRLNDELATLRSQSVDRDAVLEEAAKRCELLVEAMPSPQDEWAKCAQHLARKIRALKSKPAAPENASE